MIIKGRYFTFKYPSAIRPKNAPKPASIVNVSIILYFLNTGKWHDGHLSDIASRLHNEKRILLLQSGQIVFIQTSPNDFIQWGLQVLFQIQHIHSDRHKHQRPMFLQR